MTRARWALAALGAVSALAGGAAGAVLYTNIALAATPAASVVRFSGTSDARDAGAFATSPLAAASPKPSPGSGTHQGCPHRAGPSSSATHS